MNKSKQLMLLWMCSLITCIAIEWVVQTFESIYGIGIIAMIFLAVCMVHDFMENKKK